MRGKWIRNKREMVFLEGLKNGKNVLNESFPRKTKNAWRKFFKI